VMRNWTLARAMLDRGKLSIEVAGAKNVVAAFNAMSKQMTVSECDPRTIVAAQEKGGAPTAW
jgi:hypothetical protein